MYSESIEYLPIFNTPAFGMSIDPIGLNEAEAGRRASRSRSALNLIYRSVRERAARRRRLKRGAHARAR